MKRLRHHFLLVTALAGLNFGCATDGRPQSLTEAKAGLDNERASELALLRPALVKGANTALESGDRAYNRGHFDEAELLGYVALGRLKSADHLVAADAARAKATAMKAAGQSARTDRLERERFEALGQRVTALQADLEKNDSRDPQQQQATLAVSQARRAQGTAIGNGYGAKPAYAQGRIRLEQAVQSLDLGLFAEARGAADEAAMIFVALGNEKGTTSTAAATTTTPTKAATTSPAAARVAEAMAQARQARARARAVSDDAATLEKGSYHLSLAQEAEADGDFTTALREARSSLDLFEEAAGNKSAASTPPMTVAQTGSSSSANSSAAWTALGLARADAIGAGLPAQCGVAFDEFEAVYTLAKEQRAQNGADAMQLMVRADERLKRCQAMSRSGATMKVATTTTTSSTPTKTVDDSAARASLARAQLAISTARLSNVEQARIAEARDLVRQAEDWLARGAPSEARMLADGVPPLLTPSTTATTATAATAAKTTTTTADSRVCRNAKSMLEEKRASTDKAVVAELDKMIVDLKCTEVVARLVTDDSATTTTTTTTKTTATAGVARTAVDERVWRPAYQSILDARIARSRLDGVATSADRPALENAEQFFRQSQEAWTRADYLAAERFARAATAEYQAIASTVIDRRRTDARDSAAAAQADAASSRAAADRAAADRSAADSAAADRAAADRAAAERDAAADKAAADRAAADKAAAMGNSADKAAADKAAADKAAADKAAADKAAADKSAADKAAEKSAADKNAADESGLALRRLDVALVMCAKEACEQRDLEKLATAKRLQADATTALAEKRFARATTLANEGTVLVEQARGAPIDDAPLQAELVKKRAHDALDLCLADDCKDRDPKALAAVTASVAEVDVFFAAGNFAEVKRAGDAVVAAVAKIRATRRPFAIPASVRSVKKQNDRLVVEPRVNFRTAGTEITAGSLQSVGDLAAVIIHNKDQIQKIDLVGHTDSAGDAQKNRVLSRDRAAALKTALVERGVNADIIATDGHGEDEPIADNGTAAGRDANRRVDVIVIEQ